MHKLKAMVNRVFWAVFALWGLNLILEIEVLALVTGWLLPILFIATIAFSFISKNAKDNHRDVNQDNLFNISEEAFSRLEEEKPNLQVWKASHSGREIVVTNWFSMTKMVGAAELTIDGKTVSRSTAMAHNHREPLLEDHNNEADGFHTEVFFSGAFKVKAAIVVNGEVILRDKTSWLDRLTGKAFS